MGMMPGFNICGLSDGAAFAIRTMVRKFRRELVAAIEAQPTGRAEEVIRQTNPAVYEGALR